VNAPSPSGRGQGEGSFLLTPTPPRYRYGETRRESSQRAERARELRRDSTVPEKILWKCLRNRKIENTKFRRQYPVGPYTLDFFCEELKLCIEVDGRVHHEMMERDRRRDAYLLEHGIGTVRFRAKDVNDNIVGVLDAIGREIRERRERREPSPRPSPNGRGRHTR